MKLIAETAWHHEGDFKFMENLVIEVCTKTNADIVKLHITLDLDEYMEKKHPSYNVLKSWLFSKEQWTHLIKIIRKNKKELMLLINDLAAIDFAFNFAPEYVEIHSVCLNDIFLLHKLKKHIKNDVQVVLGVGGTSIEEIEYAVNYLKHPNILMMFGFQNYPTIYHDINLGKIRRLMKLFSFAEFGYADHTAWDSPQNELITLLGAATGMSYIEKHVTTVYGEERTDWSAAISIKMFRDLAKKVGILEELEGDASLAMNQGELEYSKFGLMKKAAVIKVEIHAGERLTKEKIRFTRTKSLSDLSQLDVIQSFGVKVTKFLPVGTVLTSKLLQREIG
jgi:N,N'-diacetyllegionaminate synthase